MWESAFQFLFFVPHNLTLFWLLLRCSQVHHNHVTSVEVVRVGDTSREASVVLSARMRDGSALPTAIVAAASQFPNEGADYDRKDVRNSNLNASAGTVIYFKANQNSVLHDIRIHADSIYERAIETIGLELHDPQEGVHQLFQAQ